MNQPDLSHYENMFSASDFDYGPDERYCGHRVIDLRDSVVTARACIVLKKIMHINTVIGQGEQTIKWRYASKPLPGKAPELIEQKQSK